MAHSDKDDERASCASGGTPAKQAGRGARYELLHGPALGSLFVSGALLALGWLVLVRPGAEVDELGLAITAGVTLALGVVLVLAPRRMPDWWFHGVGAFGTVLITAGVAFTGDRSCAATPARSSTPTRSRYSSSGWGAGRPNSRSRRPRQPRPARVRRGRLRSPRPTPSSGAQA